MTPNITGVVKFWEAALTSKQEPVAWPVMGSGAFAVGSCKNKITGTCGIIYLELPERREIGADTSDLYPVGSIPDADRILACVYFETPQAIDHTITVLREIQVDTFPEYVPPDLEALTKIAKMYYARRKSIYKNRMRLQVEGIRITEAEFNVEYDAECEKLAKEKRHE